MDPKEDKLDGIISKFETKLKQTLDKHALRVTQKNGKEKVTMVS